jgi:hypothetical protein
MEFLSALAAVIWGVSWLNVFLICAIAYGIFLLWRLHTGTNNFDLADIIMANGKADNRKLFVLVFAALSVWTIVTLVQHDKSTEVVTLLPIVLGIFVGSKVATDIWGKTPPEDK